MAVARSGNRQPAGKIRITRLNTCHVFSRDSFQINQTRIKAGKNTACCFIKMPRPNAVPDTNHHTREFLFRATNRAETPAQTKSETKWVACPASPAALGKAARQT